MKTFGLVVNLNKKGVRELVEKIVCWLEDRGRTVLINENTARALGLSRFSGSQEQVVERSQCILVFGGDGTMLRAARMVAKSGTPIIGINLGHMGFLTEIDVPEALPALENILEGHYHIEERMMLEAQVYRQGRAIENMLGLNDSVIAKGAISRPIHLKTYINDEYVNGYHADGLIIASPTGSTAYSLSAGGPLTPPGYDLMLVTPICPHSLWVRPVVVPPDSVVRVELISNHGEAMLTVDGQFGFSLRPNDKIVVGRSQRKAKFLRLMDRSFFEVLRKKLGFDDGGQNGA